MKFLTISLLIVIGVLNGCSSYPSDIRSQKILDPVLLFSLKLPRNEVDEPTNTIEYLPGKLPPKDGFKPKRDGSDTEACCPTVVEAIEPLGGKNRSGDLVELYQSEGVRQRFYEVSCAPEVAGRHCRYLDTKHKRHSKCVQQYSYTYALVREFGGVYDDDQSGGWRLDYIQVRSGCSCQINFSFQS